MVSQSSQDLYSQPELLESWAELIAAQFVVEPNDQNVLSLAFNPAASKHVPVTIEVHLLLVWSLSCRIIASIAAWSLSTG